MKKDVNEFIAAISQNDIEKVKYLIGEGYDVNKKNKYKESALITAILALNGRDTIVSFILENGGNPNQSFKEGLTALHYAVRSRKPRMVDILLKHGCNINALDDYQNTPLWYACFDVHYIGTEIVEMLLHHGADPSITNLYGRSSFFWVESRGENLQDVFNRYGFHI